MQGIREDVIRRSVEPSTAAFLDLWHQLCASQLGGDFEVILMDRREFPLTRDYVGEINTAWAWRSDTLGPILAVILEATPTGIVNEVIFTHEMGHWILKLQGFTAMRAEDPNSDTEILLNSFAHHPPLYALQRSLGVEPQKEVDARALHDLALFREAAPPGGRVHHLNNALLIADDLQACSASIASEFRGVVSRLHPEVFAMVELIQSTVGHYDMLHPAGNLRCLRMLVQRLRLGNWTALDELPSLRQTCHGA